MSRLHKILRGKDEDEWISYEYSMACTISVPGHGQVTMNSAQIQGLWLEKDYDNDNLPVIMIDLMINQEWDKYIRDAKDKAIFTFTLKKHKIDHDDYGPSVKFKKSTVISDRFIPIITDDSPIIEEKLRNKIKEKDGYTKDEFIQADSRNRYTYILVKKKDMESVRKIVNAVIAEADMTSILALALSEAKCTNVLMSNLDNTTTFKEFKLLPMPLLTNLQYINTYYGLHKEGTQIFFDTDTTYINRMNGKCTAWRKREPKKIVFYLHDSSEDNDRIAKGSIVDEDTVYYIIDQKEFTLNNTKMVTDQVVGDNSLILGSGKDAFLQTFADAGGENTDIKVASGHNPYIGNQVAIRKEEAKWVVTMLCSDTDITYLTPNKQYTIITDTAKYADDIKGNYRLCRVVTNFIRGDIYFNPLTLIELRKVPNSIN